MGTEGDHRDDGDEPPRPFPEVFGPAAARRISAVLAVGASVGAVAAAAVAIAALARGRPAPAAPLLLVLGGPLLAAGQLWAIGLMRARQPRRTAGRRASVDLASLAPWSRVTRTWMFGDLRASLVAVVIACASGGWLLAVTTFPALSSGGPAEARPGCPYALSNHGAVTCVTRRAYERAGAAEQRFAAGILLGFYSAHAGAVLGTFDRFRTGGRDAARPLDRR